KDASYRTALLGKWGLGRENGSGSPQSAGFDEFAGYLENKHAHDYYPEYIWRYDPPRPEHSGWDGRVVLHKNEGGKKGAYSTEVFSEAALNYVRINKPDHFNRYRPFFLMLSFNAPHANNELGRLTGNGMQSPDDSPYTDEDWPRTEKNKAAIITRMDHEIGRLIGKLHQLNIASNTLVLFTSDNGPHKEGGVDPDFLKSSGNLRGIKRDLYEGGIRVPLIAWWPGTVRAGQTPDLPGALWDLPATFADIALTQWPTNTDSISIYPTLRGTIQTNRHESFYWEMHEPSFHQAARIGDWKAVRPPPGSKLELYNLKTDPSEKDNIADKHPDIVAKFETYLKTARVDSPRWPVKKADDKPQAATN
ncbi:MAG TPA: sulfatase-like hydrolase/transferase, partial [Verrucomicrobiota bacterium]|nr:sulfatase-like hydrolase/transferase [Verrucomicrobiota bacterium]